MILAKSNPIDRQANDPNGVKIANDWQQLMKIKVYRSTIEKSSRAVRYAIDYLHS